MAKPDTRYKRTTNWLLAYVTEHRSRGEAMPGEAFLAASSGVSRTTVRAALDHLERRGIVERRERARHVARRPRRTDYFKMKELVSRSDQIQRVFMERISRRNLSPGGAFTETELARESGASLSSVREFLIGFARFGLIERKPRGGWKLCSFDESFARELCDIRGLLEARALKDLEAMPPGDLVWSQVDNLTLRHRELLEAIDQRYGEFSTLDRELHAMLIGASVNRFVDDFYAIISFTFHYHYQWDKSDEKERHVAGLHEHLDILEALQNRDFNAAGRALESHLATARRTLLRSTEIAGRRETELAADATGATAQSRPSFAKARLLDGPPPAASPRRSPALLARTPP